MKKQLLFNSTAKEGECLIKKINVRINKTIKMLKSVNLNALKQLDTAKLREQLMKLKGVGRKVADCIMLFGFNRMDVFPIDTWTNKVYLDYFYSGDKTRPQIANYFTSFFGILPKL